MRFEDPVKFVEFYDKQLGQNVVGLRHPESLPTGTEMLVIISPPGAPDQLRLTGRVVQVTPRADGSVRLRIHVEPGRSDLEWLGAYLQGLRAGLEREAVPSEPPAAEPEIAAPTPPPEGPAPPDVAAELGSLADRLDTATYYQLLGVPRDVEPADLQTAFHALTRRLHPDLFHAHPDRPLAKAANAVYRRMNEAYAALRSPLRRRAYDDGLTGPAHTWRLRLSEEAQDHARRQERVRRGNTRVGDYYWRRAREVLATARDADANIRPALRESARLLRCAMAFEPDNDHFRHALEQVTDRLAAREV